jgi:nucleotide-binding universal stress UspA family protein
MTRWRPAGLIESWFRPNPLESLLRNTESAVCNAPHPILPRCNRRARIACAIDLRADSARIALNASILARVMNADLVLIHVLPSIDEGVVVLAAGRDLPPTLRRDTALAELETFRFLPQSTRTMVVRGDVARALRCALRETEVDLLVAGPGRQEPGELRLGLHTLEIMRAAPCPVLVLDKKLPLSGDRRLRDSDSLHAETVVSI